MKNNQHTDGCIQFCQCFVKCTNDWYLNLDGGKYTAPTFVDLKKAFHTENHGI